MGTASNIYIYIAFLTRFVFLALRGVFLGECGVSRSPIVVAMSSALRVLAGSAYRILARPPRDLGRTLIVDGRIFTRKNMYTWS